jgi:hypothetical protein
MSPRLAGTAVVLWLSIAAASGQETDTVRTAGSDIRILPIAHGTLGIVQGENVILIDPARFVPAQPEVPRADLQELAKAYLANLARHPHQLLQMANPYLSCSFPRSQCDLSRWPSFLA